MTKASPTSYFRGISIKKEAEPRSTLCGSASFLCLALWQDAISFEKKSGRPFTTMEEAIQEPYYANLSKESRNLPAWSSETIRPLLQRPDNFLPEYPRQTKQKQTPAPQQSAGRAPNRRQAQEYGDGHGRTPRQALSYLPKPPSYAVPPSGQNYTMPLPCS